MASSGQPVSYRSNVNRAITKRWAEAKQISYEGNDWGDDDDDYYEPTPTSARSGQQPQYSAGPNSASSARRYPPPVQSNVGPRSVTNPSPTRSMGRSSFDRGDDQRNLAHIPTRSFEGPYPTARPAPFPEPQHDFEQPQYERQARPQYGHPPLHLETGSRPSSRDQAYGRGQPFMGDTRGPYRDARDSPSFGMEQTGRRSHSSGRPSQADLLGRSDSPYRTVNHPPPARSQAPRDASPTKRFPPRKSSMGQDAPAYNPPPQPEPEIAPASSAAHESTADAKPLPFIRPADIYKRVAEEREKERRSQDSARPSIDSNASRPRDMFTSARQSQDDTRPIIDAASGGPRASNTNAPGNTARLDGLGTQSTGILASSTSEENDSTPRQKPALDPVAERKSEYGFDEMLKGAGPEHPSVTPTASAMQHQQEPPSATSRTSGADPITAVSDTSNYSNRPDPITASSVGSLQSTPHILPAFRGVSDFGNDFINRGNPESPNEVRPSYVPAEPQKRSVESLTGPQQPQLPFSGQDRSMAVPDSAAAFNERSGARVAPASEQAGNEPESLHHNPSTGLRSVVHQAFDNSQSQVPPTPSSVGDSLNRSNSASASDISPIITRDVETPLGARPAQTSSFGPIAEETRPVSRPGSSSAAETSEMRDVSQNVADVSLPTPSPPFKPGYRRDSRTPSPGNSPARKAMTVENTDTPKAALATISTGTPKSTSKPWDTPRSTTEDWRDWEAQRRAFNAKAGFNDSTPTTPALTPGPQNDSPGQGTLGARQESPSRGLVRDIANKLESRSGRASPATSTDPSPDTPRPSNARLESFRPTLPGGWQSYTTNTDALTPRQEFAAQPVSAERETATPQPPVMTPHDFSVAAQQGNDEEGPRAGPPRLRREDSDYRPSQTAFAAAAAAGSALLGAFGGTANSSRGQGESETSHDVSEDESAPVPSVAPENVATRDFGDSHDQGPLVPALAGLAGERHAVAGPHESREQGPLAPALASLAENDHPVTSAPATQIDAPGSLGNTSHQHDGVLAPAMAGLNEEPHDNSQFAPPPPPAKDTPDESENNAPVSTLGYFPPPLRTSRTNGLSSPTRPPVLPALSTDMSPQDTENDRLRKEIVRSLTPKTSRQEELYSDHPLRSNEPLPQSTEARLDEGDDAELSSTDVLEDYLPPDDGNHSTATQKVSEPQHRPALEQKFSWERSEVASPQDPLSAQSPSATQVMSGSPNTVRPTSQSSPRPVQEPSRSLSRQAAPSVTTLDTIRRVQNDPSEDTAPLENAYANSNGLGLRMPPSRDAREMPFREILAMGSALDRIQTYNSNRALLANQDNGLQTWMQTMGEQTPEHTNILRSNGRMTAHEAEALASFKPSPARSKFQRLASLGNTNPSLGNTNQNADVDYDASPASNRSANPQGKKLLQTAGKFGGQAGVAAKGLFAKGKDKLRSSGGGNDKGILTNRRNSRQQLTPTEERRHSSLTAEPAPQIPNLNISAASPVREDDPWSLSSLANERTTQQPPQHKQFQQLSLSSGQAGKNMLGQLQGANEAGVLPDRRPSSRVSAVDSARDNNVPSRSISEVTRPTNSGDERSPTVARAQDRASGDHGQAGLNAAQAPLPQSTSLTPNAPVSDALGITPSAAPDDNQRTTTTVPQPTSAERALSPDHDLTPKHSDPRQHRLGALGVAPTTTRSVRESMLSGISSPSPGLPSEGAQPALDGIQRRSVSPVQQEPADPPVSDTVPPPFENAAPVNNSKEAEVAAERQQVDPTDEGLPAYSRLSEERKRAAARQSIDPASVVPVADLSSQKRNRKEPAESRPFSFVGGETLISPLTKTSIDRTAQSPIASSSLPGFDPLQKELSVVSAESSRDSLDLAKRKSKSYSRPFVTDPNVRNHPAFRPSEEIAREGAPQTQVQPVVCQVNDISPEQFQQRKVPTANQPEGYRIPGPHGHEYRSPKQVPLAFAGQAQPRSQSPPSQSGGPGFSSAHPLRSHDPQSVEQVQSPAGFGGASPAPQQQMSPPADRPEGRPMSSLLRSRSKSGSRRGRGEATRDGQPSPKKEKRGGIFRQRTKPDSESLRSDTGSFRQDSYGGRADSPQQDFGARQRPNGEERDHVGNLDNTRPPSQLRNSSSGDILQSDVKKKRFSGFGGFFGRTSSASREQGQQVESPGYSGVDAYRELKNQKQTEKPTRASTFSGLLGKSNHARPQQGAIPPQNATPQYNFPPQQVRAPFPQTTSMQHPYSAPPQRDYQPVQSFNAPAPVQQSPASAMPHGPDSFAREHYAREQDFPDHRPMQQSGYVANPQQIPQDSGRQALHIDTGSNYAPAHNLVTAPPGPAPAFPSQSPSAAPPSAPPRQPPYLNNQRPQSPYEDTRSRSPYSANTANIPKSHAIDLHKRSRSPRNGRRNSDDERDEMTRASDLANQLGTFSKASAPRSADPNKVEQEKPWEIVLPGSEEEKKRLSDARLLERAGSVPHSASKDARSLERASSTQQPATNGTRATQNTTMASEVNKEAPRKQPTVAEKLMGVQTPREREPLKAAENQQRGFGGSPVELPGSRAPGDESDEEIVMSSTAYPGQEWMPDNFGYGHWDD